MNKKLWGLLIIGLMVIISCGVVNCHRQELDAGQNPAVEDGVLGQHGDHGESPPTTAVTPGLDRAAQPATDAPKEDPPQPITQYDSHKLDQEVRAQAEKLGKDPQTYRMVVRVDADGTEIYRMIGMHVIKSPNGEEVFLPDEI